jgi:hypothetical protein
MLLLGFRDYAAYRDRLDPSLRTLLADRDPYTMSFLRLLRSADVDLHHPDFTGAVLDVQAETYDLVNAHVREGWARRGSGVPTGYDAGWARRAGRRVTQEGRSLPTGRRLVPGHGRHWTTSSATAPTCAPGTSRRRLAAYAEAGCRSSNLIPGGVHDDEAAESVADVRRWLR